MTVFQLSKIKLWAQILGHAQKAKGRHDKVEARAVDMIQCCLAREKELRLAYRPLVFLIPPACWDCGEGVIFMKSIPGH